QLYMAGYNGSLLLLVDALDEAATYTGAIDIVRLLAMLADLPQPVRLLATTRPDPRVLKQYRGIKTADLIRDAPADADDVRLYAYERLAELDEPRRNSLADRLGTAADGNFLYAHLVLRDLRQHWPQTPDVATIPLPTGLGGVYHDFLNRELGADEDRWSEAFKPVLGLIAIAQGEGLSRSQIERITGRDVEQTLRACKQYFDGDLPEGPFRPFHKSFADFLLEDAENLDYHVDAVRIHRQIASHYWTTYHEDWGRCDDYGLNSLAMHLDESGDHERLQLLISSDWLQARYAASGTYDGFLRDVEHGWKALERIDRDAIASGRCAIHLSQEIRCALIKASVNSLAATLPPTLIASLVEEGVWTSRQGLAYARQIPDARQRGEALASLASHLPDTLQPEAFAAMRSIAYDNVRAETLAAMVPHLPENLMPEVLAVVRSLPDRSEETRGFIGPDRSWALAGILPHLPQSILPAALAAVRALAGEAARAGILTWVALRFSDSIRDQLLQEALSTARGLRDGVERAYIMAGLAPHLREPQREAELAEALALARSVAGGYERARALESLARHLSGPEQERVMREALAAVLSIEGKGNRIHMLAELAPRLPQEMMADMLTAARSVEEVDNRTWILTRLLPRLPESERPQMQEEILSAARSIQAGDAKAHRLGTLAPYLPSPLQDEVVHEALDAMASKPRGSWRKAALETLAPHLPALLMPEALAAARSIEDESGRAKALAGVVPHLPEALISEVLTDVSSMQNLAARLVLLKVLIPRLSKLARQQTLRETLEVTRTIHDEVPRFGAVTSLALLTPGSEREGILREALAALRVLPKPSDWASLLKMLTTHLPAFLMRAALDVARSLPDDHSRRSMLANLAPHLPEELLDEALEAVYTVEYEFPNALESLVPYLPKTLMNRALALTRSCGSADRQANALKILASHLPDALLDEALEIARSLPGASYRAEVLGSLGLRLVGSSREEVLTEAFNDACAIQLVDYRVAALSALIPHIPEALLPVVRETVEPLNLFEDRAQVLTSLVPRLSGAAREEVLAEALKMARGPFDDPRALVNLSPHLPEPRRIEVLRQALEAVQEIYQSRDDDWDASHRGSALLRLVPKLPEALLPEALEAAREIVSPQHQADVLMYLARHMPESLVPRALRIVRSLQLEKDRAELLGSLALRLPSLSRLEIFKEALAAARQVLEGFGNGGGRAEVLEHLSPHLPEELISEAFAVACS
ncbi:MAG: hypothetical protein ACRERE_13740, partial [Candidatus Entotheonellia bacterium]